MKTIQYKGAKYSLADIPANMEPTSPADPKALVPEEKDVNEKEVTKPSPPKRVKPYDPLVGLALTKMEKRLERMRKATIPTRILLKLISRYNLPSAQILVSDWKASKERLIRKMEEVLRELGRDEQ